MSGETQSPSMSGLGLLFSALNRNQAQLSLMATPQAAPNQARVILTPGHCLLPGHMIAPSVCAELKLAAVAHAAAHLLFSEPARPTTGLKPMGVAVVSAIEDARIETLMTEVFPGTARWFKKSLAFTTDELGINFSSLIHRMSRALGDNSYEDDHFWVQKARRMFDDTRHSKGLNDYQSFRQIASILANDLGQMRVQFNAQQYVVPERYRDDHSYLWHFAEQGVATETSEDIVLPDTRRPTEARDTTQADSHQTIEVSRHFHYPEWDYQRQILKTDWCTLIETTPVTQSFDRKALPQADELKLLRRRPAKQLNRDCLLRGQKEGEQIDLNAAVRFIVSRRTRQYDEPRYFIRPQLSKRKGSILLVLDLSESSNDPIKGDSMQRTVLDIEKHAALSFARSALAHGDRVAIHGYSSDTRQSTHYVRILNFGETLTEDKAQLVMVQQAQHSTRLGAAIRHGISLLNLEHTDYRAMLLLSDGVPADIDVFDPKYLVEDAQQAVAFARRNRVICYGLTLDPQAEASSRRIFGAAHYRIVDYVNTLPRHLESCYQVLSHRHS